GIIADDLKAVRKMLALNQDAFIEQLEGVAGTVEMGLRVLWDVPNIFEYFIDRHPELRAARDRLMGHNREPRQEEKLELGQFFEQLLSEDRATHFTTIKDALAPCCAAMKNLPPRQIQEVANLSLLVERDRQDELDEAILVVAKLFDNNYAFDVNGPWAPHNFVQLNLQLRHPQPVNH
ncbi:MAG: GvpL/GvpF family gas vesicle protein, partial [Actinomycetota bacterium]